VFTAPLHSNGSYSIVACVFVSTGMCVPSSCLAVDVSSDFTIPALLPCAFSCVTTKHGSAEIPYTIEADVPEV
jgi:hypothetical protein